MKFKLTPFIIFLFLFAVFVLTMIFSHRIKKFEGFIAYNESSSTLNQLHLPQYSSSNLLYKVYDSIYFDNKNGNVIELFGTTFSNSTTTGTIPTTNVVDVTGATLTDIVLMNRSSTANAPMTISHYSSSNTTGLSVDQSLIKTSTINSYNYSITPNSSNFNSNPNISYNYQTLYISWGTDTILHIYDCSNKNNVNIGTYLFRQSFDPNHSLYNGNLTAPIGAYIVDNNALNNTYVSEPLYDSNKQNSLYQLSKNVLFDTTCRYLIIRNNGQINVYDGTLGSDGITPNQVFSNVGTIGTVKNTPTTIVYTNFTSFQPLYIPDQNGANFVLYSPVPSTDKTMVAVISMDPTVPGFISPRNVVTFNKGSSTNNGIDGNSTVVSPTNTVVNTVEVSHTTTTTSTDLSNNIIEINNTDNSSPGSDNSSLGSDIPSLDSIISNYYSKYWNNNLPVTAINGVKQYSNDFLLKTKIIPPICPACPALTCGGNSSCTNCGGNGGSGISDISYNFKKTDDNLNNSWNIDPSQNYLNNPNNYQNLNQNQNQNQNQTTKNNHSSYSLSSTSPQNLSQGPSHSQTQTVQGDFQGPTFGNRIVPDGTPDQYSYYGSLPDKESTPFIPITTDFSKFGR